MNAFKDLDIWTAKLYRRLAEAEKDHANPNVQPSDELREDLTKDLGIVRDALADLEAAIGEQYGLNSWQHRVANPVKAILGADNENNGHSL